MKKIKKTLEEYIIENYGEDFITTVWSDKNDKKPNEYSYGTAKKAWFKCPSGIHDDFFRRIDGSVTYKFKCRKCSIEEQHKDQRLKIEGQRFGRLTVLYGLHKNNSYYWHCICDCGNETDVLTSHLTSGKIQSCGCLWLERISGENNHSWKGGVTPEFEKIRQSVEYKKWRDSVFQKDWFTCQCCGNDTTVGLRAHHILNFSDYEDLRFDVDNGITLCKECHDISFKGSFHNIYGTKNNNAEQLEEYINNKRRENSSNGIFSMNEYLKGRILKS